VQVTHRDYAKYDPFRSVSWRYDRVLEMLDHKPRAGRCRTGDDEKVRAIRRFMLRYRSNQSEDKSQLFGDNPGLFYAHQIHTLEHQHIRSIVEARILARQDDFEIAEVIPTIPQAIEWYEATYFNVRDRLDCHDWIMSRVLVPALWRTEANDVSDLTLKLFGYFAGPYMLEFILSGFQRGLSTPISAEEIERYADKYFQSCLKCRVSSNVGTFEINRYNRMRLFELYAKLIEIDRSTESKEEAQSLMEKNVAAMLQEIPWMVSSSGNAKASLPEPLQKYHGMSAELRDTEIMRVAAGNSVPGIEDIQTFKLPPPRSPIERAQEAPKDESN